MHERKKLTLDWWSMWFLIFCFGFKKMFIKILDDSHVSINIVILGQFQLLMYIVILNGKCLSHAWSQILHGATH